MVQLLKALIATIFDFAFFSIVKRRQGDWSLYAWHNFTLDCSWIGLVQSRLESIEDYSNCMAHKEADLANTCNVRNRLEKCSAKDYLSRAMESSKERELWCAGQSKSLRESMCENAILKYHWAWDRDIFMEFHQDTNNEFL